MGIPHIPRAGVSGRYTAPVRVDRVAVRAVQRDTVAPHVEAQTLKKVVHIRGIEIRQYARLVKHGRQEFTPIRQKDFTPLGRIVDEVAYLPT